MPRYVAFLRGINLGQRRVKMDDLRAAFVAMKFTRVSTFIASGNVLFDSPARDDAKLAARIAAALEQTFGYEVDTFVRTREEVAAAAAFQPFSAADMQAPENTIHCGFFAAPLTAAQVRGLAACQTEVDAFCVRDRELYWLCRRIKSHESKVWSSPALRALKLPSSSMRNVTTLRKLAELFASPA